MLSIKEMAEKFGFVEEDSFDSESPVDSVSIDSDFVITEDDLKQLKYDEMEDVTAASTPSTSSSGKRKRSSKTPEPPKKKKKEFEDKKKWLLKLDCTKICSTRPIRNI